MRRTITGREPQPPLDPPVSETERLWWRREQVAIRRKVIARFTVPFLVVWVAGTLLGHPDKFHWPRVLWFAPALLGIALGCGWMTWRVMAESEEVKAIRWRRVRRALGAPTDDSERT